MAEQLRTLITKRGILKGQLTRFEQFIDNFDSSPTQLVELQKRTNKLESIWDNFNNIHAEIQNLDDKPEHDTEAIDFENKYFKLVSLAETKLSALQVPKARCVTPTGLNNFNIDLNNALNIKLPDIKLPEFTGSYDNWVQFYDTFKALIDENTKLTTIQKFYYLQSALKGDAAQSLKNLEITEANYPVAWELLKERHMKNLFELPNVTKDSHTSLRQLLDAFVRHFRALENLGQPVTTWDTVLIFLLSSKLDIASKKEWELATKNDPSPKIQDFTKFLHSRCLLLETLNSKVVTNQNNSNPKKDYKSYSHVTSVTTPNCIYCNENHYVFSCDKFQALSPNNRFQHIKSLNLCINCFRAGHSSSTCQKGTCRICKKRHNTLLHFENKSYANQPSRAVPRMNNNYVSQNNNSNIVATAQNSTAMQPNIEQASSNDSSASTTLAHYSDFNQNYILLSTAIIYVLDSQGINQMSSPISDKVHCVIKSTHNNFTIDLSFLIIDRITENIPQISIDYNSLEIPSELSLADPKFYISSPIDVLLGANIFWNLVRAGQIKSNKTNPIIQNTVLGKIPQVPNQQTICNLVTSPGISNSQLSEQLEKFWLIENLHCTQITFFRDETGRFTVSLPFRENRILGESKDQAIKRFYAIERWDDVLPPDFKKSWEMFFSQLPMLNQLKIPRQITCKNVLNTQLHGYSDSSETAYGASLYLRTINDCGEVSVQLICTKSRVAPVKTVTLPKLELCGAVLLVKLAKETITSLKLNIQHVYYWCDSSIVLSWISAHPSNWKTFVCNRVSEIQQLTDKSQWRHVPSAQNPADMITRGCPPAELLENTFWWHGPSYLLKPEAEWPRNIISKSNDIPEIKNKSLVGLNTTNCRDIFELFSEFSTLQRSVAYCLRFLRHIKQRDTEYPHDNLTANELNEATLKL
ncbi:hypothetical protein NQ317_002877, partial [Molorchus minor]